LRSRPAIGARMILEMLKKRELVVSMTGIEPVNPTMSR
jgi:hypothetical protein